METSIGVSVHSGQGIAGECTGGNKGDLVVAWTDGAVTFYIGDGNGGFGTEHILPMPNDLWKHAMLVTAGDRPLHWPFTGRRGPAGRRRLAAGIPAAVGGPSPGAAGRAAMPYLQSGRGRPAPWALTPHRAGARPYAGPATGHPRWAPDRRPSRTRRDQAASGPTAHRATARRTRGCGDTSAPSIRRPPSASASSATRASVCVRTRGSAPHFTRSRSHSRTAEGERRQQRRSPSPPRLLPLKRNR